MATYPDGVYDPRTKENKAGVEYDPEKTTIGYAEDVVKLDDEVVAIQTELGTLPKGDFVSVKALLQYLLDVIESRAKGYKVDTVQTVASASWTKVILDAELYDNLNEFDKDANYRFVAQRAGYYLVTGALSYVSVVADKRYEVAFRKNGAEATKVRVHSSSTTSAGVFICDIIYLAANDYLELWTWHNFGVTKQLGWGASGVFMAVKRVA